jgi:hypothetical protein
LKTLQIDWRHTWIHTWIELTYTAYNIHVNVEGSILNTNGVLPNGQLSYVDCAEPESVLTQHFATDSIELGMYSTTGENGSISDYST